MSESFEVRGEPTTHFSPVPLKIVFDKHGTLSPCEDITPLESIHLSMVLICATARIAVDYDAFIKEHKLERHFSNDEK